MHSPPRTDSTRFVALAQRLGYVDAAMAKRLTEQAQQPGALAIEQIALAARALTLAQIRDLQNRLDAEDAAHAKPRISERQMVAHERDGAGIAKEKALANSAKEVTKGKEPDTTVAVRRPRSDRRDAVPTSPQPAVVPHATSATLAPSGTVDLASLLRVGTQRYEFRGELGRGGMGVVKRAYDSRIRREVAVKTINPNATPNDFIRFVEEVQITGQLEHPNIVPVHELAQNDRNELYFTMKLVRGRSLKATIKQLRADIEAGRGDRNFPVAQRLEIVKKVADALMFAHSKGVIHRDLKPENVMVGEFGEVLVMDWGLAKVLGESAWEPDMAMRSAVRTDRNEQGLAKTLAGELVGTPRYMAPEQAQAGRPVDVRTDIYALGALLYELLTTTPPYTSEVLWMVLHDAKQGAWDPPQLRLNREFGTQAPQLPRELAAIVTKAMERQPLQRYQSVAEFRADIDAFVTHGIVSALNETVFSRIVKWVRRNTVLAITTGFLAVVVLVAVMAAAQYTERNQQLEQKDQQLQHLRDVVAREMRKSETAASEVARLVGEAVELRRLASVAEATRDQAENEARSWRKRFEEATRNFTQSAMSDTARDLHQRVLGARLNGKTSQEFFLQLDRTEAQRLITDLERVVSGQIETKNFGFEDVLYLGLLYCYSMRDYARAEICFHQALELRVNTFDALLGRGTCRVQQRNYRAAVTDLDQAAKLDSNRSEVFYARAIAHREQGNSTAAMDDFNRAIQLRADHWQLFYERAFLRRQLKDLSGALADCDRAVQLAPNSGELLGFRGVLRAEQGMHAAALEDVHRAVDLEPRSPTALIRRGIVLIMVAEHQKAIADLLAAIDINPRHYAAWANLGVARDRLGDKTGAATAWEQAWRVAVSDVDRQTAENELAKLGRTPPR